MKHTEKLSTHILALSSLCALSLSATPPATAQELNTPQATSPQSNTSTTPSQTFSENFATPTISSGTATGSVLLPTSNDIAQSGLADARNTAGDAIAPLTLTEAIYLVLQNNPQRDAARAALAAARARIGNARSAGGLQVGLSADENLSRSFGFPSTRTGGGGTGGGGTGDPGGGTGGGGTGDPGGGTGGGGTGDPGGGTNTQKLFGFTRTEQVGLNATLPIYNGGRVRSSTRVAEANARSRAAQALQTDQDLVLSTIDAYLSILRSDQLLQVAQSNLEVSRERLRVAQVRFDAGAAARLEVFRAQTTLSDAQTRRITASNAVAQSKSALNTLIGRAPETPLRVEPITRLTPRVPLPAAIAPVNNSTQSSGAAAIANAPSNTGALETNGEQLRALAEQSRPSLQAAREQVDAADANIDVAKAQRRPNLGLSIGGLLRNPVTFAGRFALSLGLGVAQTLFDSGRARSQIDEARATKTQLKQDLLGQRLNVANQIDQSLLALDSAQERERSTDIAVVSAQESLRAAQIGYAAGVLTSLEVSDAQNALLEAQTQAVNARFDVADAQAQLSSSVGVLTTEGQAAYQRALLNETQAARAEQAQKKNSKKK